MTFKDPPSDLPRNITTTALVVELGLGVGAVLLAWLLGQWPMTGLNFENDQIQNNANAVILGVVAALPMFGLLLIIQRVRLGPFARLNEVVDELLVPMFSQTSIIEFAIISLAAGVGEELFFRSFLQLAIADVVIEPYGVWIGIAFASVVFGICHWITPMYAALATLIGVYFSWLFIVADYNLVAPIVAHALYDFVALIYLVKIKSVDFTKDDQSLLDQDRDQLI